MDHHLSCFFFLRFISNLDNKSRCLSDSNELLIVPSFPGIPRNPPLGSSLGDSPTMRLDPVEGFLGYSRVRLTSHCLFPSLFSCSSLGAHFDYLPCPPSLPSVVAQHVVFHPPSFSTFPRTPLKIQLCLFPIYEPR